MKILIPAICFPNIVVKEVAEYCCFQQSMKVEFCFLRTLLFAKSDDIIPVNLEK